MFIVLHDFRCIQRSELILMYLSQNSIDHFNPEGNIKLSKRFFDFLGAKLGVSDSRAYVYVHIHSSSVA